MNQHATRSDAGQSMCNCSDPVHRASMLIPATVVLSEEEATLEIMDVDQDEATFLYAMCETCGWDSRREPTGAVSVFERSVALLNGVMLYQPL